MRPYFSRSAKVANGRRPNPFQITSNRLAYLLIIRRHASNIQAGVFARKGVIIKLFLDKSR
jgi:hypothetical protein